MFHGARRYQTLKPGVPVVFSVTNREKRCTFAGRKLPYQSEVRRIEIRKEDALDDADERICCRREVVERAISENTSARPEEACSQYGLASAHQVLQGIHQLVLSVACA